ncbi:MAG TPA: substrate-binding domain-containing protein [Actinomycetota bacterium]
MRIAWILVVVAVNAAALAGPAGAQELTVLLNPKSVDNPFFLDARDGCQAGAKQFGVKCEFNGTTESDVAKQVQFLENRLSAGKLSCAAISANDVAPLVPVIAKYEAAGVPVITWDSDVDGSKRRAFIGIDSKDAGRQAGQLLLKFFPKGYKPKAGGAKIQIAIGTGGLGAPNLNDRIAGFRETIDKDGRFEVVSGSPFPDDDDVGKSIKVLQDVLAAHPKLDGFFISNTLVYFSPAFESTLKAAGRIKANGTSDLVHVGFDPTSASVPLVAKGLVSGLVAQPPVEYGRLSVELCKKLVTDKLQITTKMTRGAKRSDGTPWFKTPTFTVTKENAKKLFPQYVKS